MGARHAQLKMHLYGCKSCVSYETKLYMYLAVWQARRANQQHVDGTLYRLNDKFNCHSQEHDTTQCGFAYSTADQVAYCPVQEPPIWPALLQLPEDQYSGDVLNTSSTAGDSMNMSSAPLLYTGADRATADALMAALFARNQSLGGAVHSIHAQAVLLNCIDFVQMQQPTPNWHGQLL